MTPAQQAWARCRPWIEGATIVSDFYSIEYIEGMIESGSMVLWPGQHGAVATELKEYPKCRVLNVFAGGGDDHRALREFVEVFHPRLCAYAKENGCKWIAVTGREGWKRIGASLGYKHICTVIGKDLTA